MKNKVVFLFIGVFLLQFCLAGFGSSGSDNDQHLRIQYTPDLQMIAKAWADEYVRLHPGASYEAVPVTELQKNGIPGQETNFSLVSDHYFTQLEEGASWKMIVGEEVTIPVISSKNAYKDLINKQGIRMDELANIGNDQGKPAWGMLLGNTQNARINIYVVNNGSIRARLQQLIGTDPYTLEGIKVGSRKEVISAVQNDPYGIGFCSLTDLVDPISREMTGNIVLLPIDKNKNGHLDHFENIYGDLNSIARGVWIGIYPRSLRTTIYSISSEKPSDKASIDFLNWLITGGQQFLSPAGNQDFTGSERYSDKISMLQSIQPAESTGTFPWLFQDKIHDLSLFSLVIILLIPFILAFMIGEAIVSHKRQRRISAPDIPSGSYGVFDENTVEVPRGLFFDKTHMWAFMEKNGMVRIGVDDFLQHITGPLTSIKMRETGDRVKKGDQILTLIQNGKQLSILAPISGIIKAHNPELSNNTSVLNTSPYSDGWVYILEPTKWVSEVRVLSMAEKYQDWLKKEFARLKDFVAASLKSRNEEFAHIILQDGGELKDGVLADLGPREWEDFQTHFIDKTR